MEIYYRIRCLIHRIFFLCMKKEVKNEILMDMKCYGKSASLEKTLVRKPNFRSVFYYRLNNRCLKKICNIILPAPYGIEIWAQKIGGGLLINHKMGCTILANTIGENCTVLQGVTIGKGKETENGELPTIGNNVRIMANAVVIGGISIGDNAVIGAGAVVIKDVPAGAVMAGVPAKVVRIEE